jgi:hypothetical protein
MRGFVAVVANQVSALFDRGSKFPCELLPHLFASALVKLLACPQSFIDFRIIDFGIIEFRDHAYSPLHRNITDTVPVAAATPVQMKVL